MVKTKENGHVGVIRDIEIEIEHESGVKLYFTRLAPWIRLAIFAAVEQELSYPDAKLYAQPLPNAAIEGDMTTGEESPEYRVACREIDLLRNRENIRRIIYAALVRTDPPQTEIIAHYGAQVEKLRGFGYGESDDWKATVEAAFLTTSAFINQVTSVLIGEAELTEAEVLDYVRLFRLPLEGRKSR